VYVLVFFKKYFCVLLLTLVTYVVRFPLTLIGCWYV